MDSPRLSSCHMEATVLVKFILLSLMLNSLEHNQLVVLNDRSVSRKPLLGMLCDIEYDDIIITIYMAYMNLFSDVNAYAWIVKSSQNLHISVPLCVAHLWYV